MTDEVEEKLMLESDEATLEDLASSRTFRSVGVNEGPGVEASDPIHGDDARELEGCVFEGCVAASFLAAGGGNARPDEGARTDVVEGGALVLLLLTLVRA